MPPKKSKSMVKSAPKNLKAVLEMFEDPVPVDNSKLATAAASIARYIVLRGQPDATFHKKEFLKLITDGARTFDKVIARTEEILKEVYGYKLHISEATKSDRLYVVSNNLPYLELDNTEAEPDDHFKILIMLVLSHIFMSNNRSSDTSLYCFLQSLNIEMEETDPMFGKVKEYITKSMVKQRYLAMEANQVGNKAYYAWGSKAECTISKQKILEFVSKMYKCKPTNWANLCAVAQEQTKSFESDNEDNKEDDLSIVEENTNINASKKQKSQSTKKPPARKRKSNKRFDKSIEESFLVSDFEDSDVDDSD